MRQFAADGHAAAIDIQNHRVARLDHLHAAAGAQPHLTQSTGLAVFRIKAADHASGALSQLTQWLTRLLEAPATPAEALLALFPSASNPQRQSPIDPLDQRRSA